MYHPTTRVLTILDLLQARGSLSGGELAARLEVEGRTVRRYITMLQDMGIPIEATRGPGGGYRLRPGFKLPPLMLSDDEGLAITLSLIAARRAGLPVESHTIEGTLAKIERVLPESLRQRLQAVQAAVTFSPAPAKSVPPASELVLLLSAAVQEGRRVQVRYGGRPEETLRAVDPYGLVSHWERWYLVGWCHLRQDVRVFRLDRILGAAPEAALFERRTDFDSLGYVLESLASAPQAWPVEVLLETTLDAAQRRLPPGTAILEQTAAGVVMHAQAERLDWLARQLLTYEFPFLIRRPPELIAALRAVGAEALALANRAADAIAAAEPSDGCLIPHTL